MVPMHTPMAMPGSPWPPNDNPSFARRILEVAVGNSEDHLGHIRGQTELRAQFRKNGLLVRVFTDPLLRKMDLPEKR